MKNLFSLAALLLFSIFSLPMRANPTPAARVAEIQSALLAAKLDGWLFYDFRGSDPLAPRILMLGEDASGSRRWFYYIPASGEPTKIVHSIERSKLDPLPGKRLVYRGWEEQRARLRETLSPAEKKKPLRVAMQYSPMNDIPYISRVDAGTIELIRSFGVEPVTSAELVQQFEAVLTPEQKQSHVEASDKMHRVLLEAFAEIGRNIRADKPMTEYDIQQFIARRLEEEGMERENGIVAVNANTANPHYFPTRQVHSPIKRGDFVLLDIVSKLRSRARFAPTKPGRLRRRTVPEEFTRISISSGKRAMRDESSARTCGKAKASGAEVDDVSRGVIKRAGYAEQFTHRPPFHREEGNGKRREHRQLRDARLAPHHPRRLLFHRAGHLPRRKIRSPLRNRRLRSRQGHRSDRPADPNRDRGHSKSAVARHSTAAVFQGAAVCNRRPF